MINVSRIWCGIESSSDALRYGESRHGAQAAAGAAGQRKPVVVWNMTRTCNLHCVHCYTDSNNHRYPGELSRKDVGLFLKDLADYGVPALLLSGGEPMVHSDFWEIAENARSLGLRLTLSTNGTLIGRDQAERLRILGFTYVGISLDGIGEINDRFRGQTGAFKKVVEAFRHCLAAGQRTGLRMTLTRHNINCLDQIFDFIESEGIPRACFYHLAYTGRGQASDDVTPSIMRTAMDRICERTTQLAKKGSQTEILTVANSADGPYLLMKARRERHPNLDRIEKLLTWNKGNHFSSGTGIANVDFFGNVHPDQFWRSVILGNVRQKPFSRIWGDGESAVLSSLRNRKRINFPGRCGRCHWFDLCGAGLRARAHQMTGGRWEDDPGCYLRDEEIVMESSPCAS